jgi:hypothetical protein
MSWMLGVFFMVLSPGVSGYEWKISIRISVGALAK